MITLRLRHKHRVCVSSPVLQELSTVSLEDHTYRHFGFRALRPVNRRLLHLRAMHIEEKAQFQRIHVATMPLQAHVLGVLLCPQIYSCKLMLSSGRGLQEAYCKRNASLSCQQQNCSASYPAYLLHRILHKRTSLRT